MCTHPQHPDCNGCYCHKCAPCHHCFEHSECADPDLARLGDEIFWERKMWKVVDHLFLAKHGHRIYDVRFGNREANLYLCDLDDYESTIPDQVPLDDALHHLCNGIADALGYMAKLDQHWEDNKVRFHGEKPTTHISGPLILRAAAEAGRAKGRETAAILKRQDLHHAVQSLNPLTLRESLRLGVPRYDLAPSPSTDD